MCADQPYAVAYAVTMKVDGHRLNGRICYVGITRNFEHRVREHLVVAAKGPADRRYKIFQAAIRKYGADKFIFNVIGRYDNWLSAQQAETAFIVEHGSSSDAGGYNMTFGGEGFGELTLAARKRISASKKQLYSDPKARADLVLAIKQSPAYQADLVLRSERAKEVQNRPEVKAAIRAARMKPEIRRSESERMKKAMASPQVRSWLSEIGKAYGRKPEEREARRRRSIESQNREDVRRRKSQTSLISANKPDVKIRRTIGVAEAHLRRYIKKNDVVKAQKKMAFIEDLKLKYAAVIGATFDARDSGKVGKGCD